MVLLKKSFFLCKELCLTQFTIVYKCNKTLLKRVNWVLQIIGVLDPVIVLRLQDKTRIFVVTYKPWII